MQVPDPNLPPDEQVPLLWRAVEDLTVIVQDMHHLWEQTIKAAAEEKAWVRDELDSIRAWLSYVDNARHRGTQAFQDMLDLMLARVSYALSGESFDPSALATVVELFPDPDLLPADPDRPKTNGTPPTG